MSRTLAEAGPTLRMTLFRLPILSYVWTVINVGKTGASDHASRKQPFGPDLNRNISTCGIASIMHLGRECVLFWVQGVESKYRYRTSGYR